MYLLSWVSASLFGNEYSTHENTRFLTRRTMTVLSLYVLAAKEFNEIFSVRQQRQDLDAAI